MPSKSSSYKKSQKDQKKYHKKTTTKIIKKTTKNLDPHTYTIKIDKNDPRLLIYLLVNSTNILKLTDVKRGLKTVVKSDRNRIVFQQAFQNMIPVFQSLSQLEGGEYFLKQLDKKGINNLDFIKKNYDKLLLTSSKRKSSSRRKASSSSRSKKKKTMTRKKEVPILLSMFLLMLLAQISLSCSGYDIISLQEANTISLFDINVAIWMNDYTFSSLVVLLIFLNLEKGNVIME